MINEDFGFNQDEPEILPVEAKLVELEKLILPLLKRLLKNPTKDIHWPNRASLIEAQIAKILKITRGQDNG